VPSTGFNLFVPDNFLGTPVTERTRGNNRAAAEYRNRINNSLGSFFQFEF